MSDEYGRETGEDYDDRDPCVCGHADAEHDVDGECALCSCMGFRLDTDTTPYEAI